MMDDSFSTLVDSASSILILLPNKPYFDQVAAGLSLYLSLREKKPTVISSPSPMVVGFNRLIGVNKITSEIGNKNLTITFPNYDAGNIEKVSYDIENGQFKLTVVPKTGLTSPQKEQIEVTHTGVSADLVVLIGGANESHFPILSSPDLSGAKIAHIGTRVLNSEGRGTMSFAKPASSVSELVASLIKELELPMDVDCATNLVMGVEEGSNHFESSEVTPDTFEVFAYLLRNGGQRLPKQKLEPRNFPPGSIPGQPFPAPKAVQQNPVLEKVEEKEEVVESPPQDWLQPKVYKGTSIS
jgi:hypothetical protein